MAAPRPLLTFDLDGVLCRPPLGINPARGRNTSRTGQGSRNLLWLTERWRYRGRRPMAGAVEGFRRLAERYECHVLSARGERSRPLTEAWLARYLGPAPPLHLRGDWRETPAQFKARMTEKLRPLAHFEDDPHTAAWLAETLPAVFLIDWRRNRWLTGERVHRMQRLEDALPLLKELTRDPGAPD
ncbi:MAG: hypothetical protein ACR2HN_07590 [Tepidiformaceae bacterium]